MDLLKPPGECLGIQITTSVFLSSNICAISYDQYLLSVGTIYKLHLYVEYLEF